MRLLLISDIASEHTEKWALGLANAGVQVGLFSFNKASYPWYSDNKNITLLYESKKPLNADRHVSKLSYLRYVNKLMAVIKKFKPDVLHAHYATSYGLIGALSGFHPFVISAWGTDVMKFPQKSFINKSVLKYNLRNADVICATSETIKTYLKPVTNKSVKVIPFGVDVDVFKPKTVESLFDKDCFVIGSIKGLEPIYNIDVLIKSFKEVKTKYPAQKIKLLIVGVGTQESELKQLVNSLQITNDVVFTGRVPFSKVSDYFNMIDVLVNISNYESFGVSVIEAMACGKAVVVTNTGGLKEIIEDEKYGSLVEIGSVSDTCKAIEKYLNDTKLLAETGLNARKKVTEKYSWNNNIKQMIDVYDGLIHKK